MIEDPTTGLRIMTEEEYEEIVNNSFQKGVARGWFEAKEAQIKKGTSKKS
ncbi:hypothetical protein UFOVP434_19 [uncultured Caudovirales phage]|uniref:Uncharacterized protein n=1 Tax=uncultured Caudovirales phage TaxID=2100421 RepID=A0A6J5MC02_9CAUD|nr:hypothetical protein UFOVP434_19 [uncultured Caudovirales phage]